MCIALLAVSIALFSFSACSDANNQTTYVSSNQPECCEYKSYTDANIQTAGVNSAEPERWEYRMVRVGCCCEMNNMVNQLNRLGQEGWKLVSITRIDMGVGGIVKRRLP